MAPGIWTPPRGRRRPAWPFAVNWDHPLTAHLVAYFPILPFGLQAGQPNLASERGATTSSRFIPKVGSESFTWVTDDMFGSLPVFPGGNPTTRPRYEYSTESPLSNTIKLSILLWARPAASPISGNDDCMIQIGNEGADGEYQRLGIAGPGATNEEGLRIITNAGGGSNEAVTSSDMQTDEWHHCAGIVAAANSRRVILNGSITTADTNTGTRSPDQLSELAIGWENDSTPGDNWDGQLADIFVFDIALTDDQCIEHYHNPFELIFPLSRRLYTFAKKPAGDPVIAHRASRVHNETNPTTSATITIPQNVKIGDVLYVGHMSRDGGSAQTCTDDDTDGNLYTKQIGDSSKRFWLHTKIATANTAGKTITVTANGSTAAGLTVFHNVDGNSFTNLIDEQNGTGDETQAGFTPDNADSMICLAMGMRGNDDAVDSQACTDPGVLGEIWEVFSTGGNDTAVNFSARRQVGGPTATGAFTWNQPNDGPSNSAAWAIKPAKGIIHTLLTRGTDEVDKTIYTTASVTPAANNLMLAAVYVEHISGDAKPPDSLSGNGLTWVKVDDIIFSGDPDWNGISLWRAMGSAPTAGAITITFPGTHQVCHWYINQFSGVDTGGADGADAIVQSANNKAATGTSLTVTLASFADSVNNVAFGFLGLANLDEAVTPGAGFEEIGQRNTLFGGDQTSQVERKTGEDLSVDWSWATSGENGGIAVEIAIAAGAPWPPAHPPGPPLQTVRSAQPWQ